MNSQWFHWLFFFSLANARDVLPLCQGTFHRLAKELPYSFLNQILDSLHGKLRNPYVNQSRWIRIEV